MGLLCEDKLRYVHKPTLVTAIQWTGKNVYDVAKFLQGHTLDSGKVYPDSLIVLEAHNITMITDINDWLVKTTDGKYFPCKSDEFEKNYEEMGEKKE